MKEAETTAASMCVFPFNTAIVTLAPLISTSQYPYLLGAIKMLTKLIEAHPTEVMDEHLMAVMPGLIKVSKFLSIPDLCCEK